MNNRQSSYLLALHWMMTLSAVCTTDFNWNLGSKKSHTASITLSLLHVRLGARLPARGSGVDSRKSGPSEPSRVGNSLITIMYRCANIDDNCHS